MGKKYLVLIYTCILLPSLLSSQTKSETIRRQKQAEAVTIVRDVYGVPHIFGKTDADCVFGLMYTQCEDDFYRVEMNYITMLGRTAELKTENEVYEDLLVRMTIDSAGAVKDYERAPLWMKSLLQAWSDGIHYYLSTHPEVKPRLLTEFKPWYPLMYTDGSIAAIQTGGIE
ncbi:MAG: penicillin acylase family protein, partial [Chitinophagaceae bacterium]